MKDPTISVVRTNSIKSNHLHQAIKFKEIQHDIYSADHCGLFVHIASGARVPAATCKQSFRKGYAPS